MKEDRIGSPIGAGFLSFRAGTIGGIIAAVIEILVISRFGASPANFSALLFALVSYGFLGGILGLLGHFLLVLLPFHRERRESRSELSSFMAALSLSAVLFLIFVFRVFRDFWLERVKPTQPTGMLTILVLLGAAIVVFFLLKLLFQRGLSDLLGSLLKPLGYILLLVVLIIAGFALQATLGKETEVVTKPFSPGMQAELGDKPCIILIMVDTMRPDRLGCYGNSQIATPNIDALANEGILFRQTYAQATNTKPSTASLLSSRYQTEHQAIEKTSLLPDTITTIAEVLGQAGYYCGGIVSNINLAPNYNFQQGFHEYSYLSPRFLFGAKDSGSRLVIYGVLRLIRMRLVKSLWVDDFYRSGEKVTGQFSEFLERAKDRKFFLFLHYMDPHDPYFEHPYNGKGYARVVLGNPPENYAEPFQSNYRQEIEYLDGWIGEVITQLKAEGIYDSCLFVLTSDHGEEFYEHGGWWHGSTLHEEQVRVPLIIKKPGSAEAGKVDSTELARSIDIVPTLLASAGLEIPPEMRGRNLFAAADSSAHDWAYSEADFEGNVVQMLRIGSWKYIRTNLENRRHRPPEQLFNVLEDTWEQTNLLERETDKTGEMRALLEAEYKNITATKVEGVTGENDRANQERLRALGYTQ